MLYGLYASTFFSNVLFYMTMLAAVPDDELIFYNAAFMILCSLGLVLYGFCHQKLAATVKMRVLYGTLLLNCTGGIMLHSTTGRHLFLLFALLLFTPAYGYLTAHIAKLSAYAIPIKKQGLFVGTSLALANLFLYFALLLPKEDLLFPFIMSLGLTCLLLHRIERISVNNEAPLSLVHRETIRKYLPLAVLIAAMLGTLVGLDDSIFIPHFAEYDTAFFGISRLFTAGGFLLAGFVADLWPFYLPLIAIAAKSVPLFVRAGSPEFLLALLSYTDAFFTGALIVLVIRLFFFIAPYTKRPALWAGMGRGIELPASGLAAFFGTLYLEKAGIGTIIAVHAAVLLACALLFYQALIIYARTQNPRPITAGDLPQTFSNAINTLTNGELTMAATADLPLMNPAGENSTPDLDALRSTYDLTDRETEVLAEVLKEKSITDIAAALFVTERTVKFHIGNLLKKTDCKNQKELREKIKG